MLYQNICPSCGAKNFEKISDTQYQCKHCDNVYSIEKVENYADKLSKFSDESKLELISNAKKNLYAAVTDKYISKVEVTKWCNEVKKYLPDDFQANFYEGVLSKTRQEVAKMIRKIDVEKDFDCLETIIKFLICSLEIEFVIATKDLIERAYYRSDKEKYYKYTSAVENEAEKLDNFIYSTTYPRKAFVAYSSKDAEKAMELVETLEAQGISCFISIRNLRHGAGSRENYDKSLKEAMDNCTSFVFVSSMNSRNAACDALKIEIPYVMQSDKNNAPGNLRNYYSRIPNEYKKPRVEYRIQESMKENFADELVDEFFDGYERVYTANDVAKRVLRQSVGFDIVSPMPEKREKTEKIEKIEKNEIPKNNTENELKFCVACLSENSKDAQKCSRCGRERFVADFATASQIRKREKDEQLSREFEKRKQEEEKQRLEAERRKQEQEKQKLEAEKRKEEEANRKREAEEARRKREAELALIAEEERKKRRKKFGILSAVAIILILTILFVWVVPLIRDNKSEPLNNNAEILNGMNNNTTNINDTNNTTNNIANNNNSTVDSDTEEDTVASDVPEVKKITFGSYPQTMVTNQVHALTLTNIYEKYLECKDSGREEEFHEYYHEYYVIIEENFYEYYIDGKVSNFMEYVDIEENGYKYRGVRFTSYRPNSTISSSSADNSNQDDNGYTTSKMYWFEYEPISWTILSENTSDGTALILCDMIIDSQQFDYDGSYSNNYAQSTIRKWLNETFYNTAFSELQKQIILTTTVDNSRASTGYSSNPYACENTEDKIFLLSAQEVTNTAYGFASSMSTYDTVRQKKTTDYAQAQGAYTSTSTDHAGNGWWWLRSPYKDSDYACAIYCDGDAYSRYSVSSTSNGVVPALHIKLSELN